MSQPQLRSSLSRHPTASGSILATVSEEKFAMQPMRVVESDPSSTPDDSKQVQLPFVPVVADALPTETEQLDAAIATQPIDAGSAATQSQSHPTLGRRARSAKMLAGHGTAPTAISSVHLYCMPYQGGIRHLKKGFMTRSQIQDLRPKQR